ncbi:MAG: polyprenyl synthetase family protein [Proteobacteria bacterium]|nr:polyprenyl synthetase family protein [Pseudomonadota bacterium]
MSLTAITSLLSSELKAVNDAIIRCLESHVAVINDIGHYMINSGGKRIRPLVVLLSSKACDAKDDDMITMSAIIEFIHTATLLHDDVVDSSKLRRGRLTAHRVWDNATAILVGDFLYSRAFQMMVTLNNMSCMRLLADATNVIAEGEVLQLTHRFQPDLDETHYLKVLRYKTATLFEAASQLGAVLAKQPHTIEQALRDFGLHLGIAYQLVDDVLDYSATNESWGKNIGNDLSEGKATLPLMYALKHASAKQANVIRHAIQVGSLDELSTIQEVIIASGAIDYTMQVATQEVEKAKKALNVLKASAYRDALHELASFTIHRGS